MNKCIKTIFVFVLAISSIVGQFSKSEMDFYHIDTDQGLTDNRVNNVLKGPEGFIWFGTSSGLNKYNGYSIKKYTNSPLDSTSLTNNYINDMIIGPQDKLWIATSKGLNKYIPQYDRFQRYLTNNYISELNIIEDRWLAVCTGNGLWVYDTDLKKFNVYRHEARDSFSINSNQVCDVLTLNNGKVLVVTDSRKIQQFHVKEDSFTTAINNTGLPGEAEKFLSQDSEGYLWIGTEGKGLYRYKFDKNKIIDYTSKNGNDIRKTIPGEVTELSGKKLLIPTQSGLHIFDMHQKDFDILKSNPKDEKSLSSSVIRDIFFDKKNNILWLATYKGGVNVYDPERTKFKLMTNNPYDPSSLSPNPVMAIFKDSNQNLWIGTDQGGLNLKIGKGNNFRHFSADKSGKSPLSSDAILDIAEYPKGQLLVGTWGGGINKIEINNNYEITSYTPDPSDSNSIPTNHVFDIFVDSQNRIWFTAWEAGIGIFNYQEETFRVINSKVNIPNYFLSINEDQFGNIWFIGENTGVWIYDNNSKIIRKIDYYTKDSLSSSIVGGRQLYFSRNKYMWIPSVDGLYKIDPKSKKTVQHYTMKDGLPTNSLVSITEDQNGKYWIGSAEGLIEFDPGENEFTGYNLSDGLQGNQFGAGVVYEDSEGYLYFGGNNGYNKFHPEQIPINNVPPQIVFTDFKVFNKSVDFEKKNATLNCHINKTNTIKLSHSQNVFTFEFAALNYTNPHQNKYAYKLEGFDDSWKYVGNKRTANFTNIDPGEYTFKIKAANNDGVWNQKGRTIDLIIIPPFWKTKWFIGLSILTILLIIAGIIRYRTYVVRKRNQLLQEKVDKRTEKLQDSLEQLKIAKKEAEQAKEKAQESDRLKSEFLANMSHEIRTPMNSIIGFAKVLKNDIEKEEKKEQLNIIYNSGKNLLNLINDILDLSKIEAGKMEISPVPFSLKDLIKRFSKMFEKRAHKKDLYFDVEISDNIPDSVIGDDSRINQILINLTGNAIKFTKEGGVTIRCDYDRNNEEAILEIEDTGIGIPPAKQEKIFEPFRQADASTTREFGGTGLGLAISMKLINLMEGNIELESEEGVGSTFTITLPLSKASFSIQKEEGCEIDKDIANKRIGIVEDDERDKKLLKNILDRNGFIPIGLKNTASINEEVIHKKIDLIILDLVMDKPDGLELNRILKNDPRTAHIPVLVCSGVDKASETVYYGVVDYMKKPIQEEEVLRHVYSAISIEEEVKNVFVIDDNKTATKLYSTYLNNHGYCSFAFEKAQTAMEKIKKGNLPDLVILDLMMPDIDGFEFLDNLRAEYGNEEIPVIVVTAKELTQEERKILREDTLKIFKKGDNTESKFISFINNYFSRTDKKGKELVNKWLEKSETEEEKRRLCKTLRSLSEIVKKEENAINEKKTSSLQKYTQNLINILKNNGMQELIRPIEKMKDAVNKVEINWNKVMLNFLEFRTLYSNIPKEYLDKQVPEEQHRKIEGKVEIENEDLKILVAEDNPTNQKLIEVYFNRMGLECALAKNGQKAFNKIKDNEYDVLFLDIQMPVMDGMETLDKIKNSENIESPYIVALTAHAMKGDEEKYLQAGCDDYMAKPLEFSQLKKKIDAIEAQLEYN